MGAPLVIRTTARTTSCANARVLLVVTTDEYINTPTGFTLGRAHLAGNSLYAFRKATTGGETSFTSTTRACGRARDTLETRATTA